MKIQKHLPYNYTAYTGKIISDCHINQYNFLTDRINACIKTGLRPSVGMLNERHRLFVLISEK